MCNPIAESIDGITAIKQALPDFQTVMELSFDNEELKDDMFVIFHLIIYLHNFFHSIKCYENKLI